MADEDDFTQSDEERAAQYAPGSPVAAAREWLKLVLEEGSLDSAWPLTDEPLRRLLAEAWFKANSEHPLVLNEDRSAFCDALSQTEPRHRLWPRFAESQVREFQQTWDWLDLTRYGWGSRPRPIAPDEEFAVLIETLPGGEVVATTEARDGLGFRMKHVGQRWLVAGFELEVRD